MSKQLLVNTPMSVSQDLTQTATPPTKHCCWLQPSVIMMESELTLECTGRAERALLHGSSNYLP